MNLDQAKLNLGFADHLASAPHSEFNLTIWGGTKCGTPGCIAAHACRYKPYDYYVESMSPDLIAEKMGLSLEEKRHLFMWGYAPDQSMVTPAEAAQRLREIVYANFPELRMV